MNKELKFRRNFKGKQRKKRCEISPNHKRTISKNKF